MIKRLNIFIILIIWQWWHPKGPLSKNLHNNLYKYLFLRWDVDAIWRILKVVVFFFCRENNFRHTLLYQAQYSTSQKFGHTFLFIWMRKCVQTFDWYCILNLNTCLEGIYNLLTSDEGRALKEKQSECPKKHAAG